MTVLSPDVLRQVAGPIETASGLPNASYIDNDVFAEERRAVLFNQWAGVGFGKDIPEPGDVKPIRFLGLPLLAVRDRNGEVRVYQNTCRHRGMILVDEPKRLNGVIRCPYHSWCYGLGGELRTTPHVGGPGFNSHDALDRDSLGLVEFRSTIWSDVIFVNVSGTAPAFEAYCGDLWTRWQAFDQPSWHGGPESSFKIEVNTNWKLAVENYCESYHLPWVHPGLNSYSRLEDHYNILQPGHYSGQGTEVYRPSLDDEGRSFPDYAGLSSQWDRAAEYIAVYPNVLLGVHRDHRFAIVLEPVAIDRTIEHIELYYSSEDAARGAEFLDLRQRNAHLWKTVFEEDVFVVEGMQRGRHGEAFDGGRFSPVMDPATHAFHQWVAKACLESSASAE
ncbi:aromatic ring-hydroxylating dioxygenase subunit alpha [Gammaproteobacteria bacterium]|nr:aromatic ring-hydroxylating dioxygenase subunit alpha [Gammaproteobacteria bacterium]